MERYRYHNEFARTFLLSGFFILFHLSTNPLLFVSLGFVVSPTFMLPVSRYQRAFLGVIRQHRFHKLRVFPGMRDNCIIRWPVLIECRLKKCCIG